VGLEWDEISLLRAALVSGKLNYFLWFEVKYSTLVADEIKMIKMMLLTVIVVLIATSEPVCGKLRSVPHHNPSSCRRMTVRGHMYDSFFSSIAMMCKPCSQPYGFQRRSKDGQSHIIYLFYIKTKCNW